MAFKKEVFTGLLPSDKIQVALFDETRAYGLPEPELIDLDSDFRVNLYRRTMEFDQHGVVDPRLVAKTDATNATNSATNLSEDEEKILSVLKEKTDITQKELHEMTGITLGTIKRLLPKLQKKGMLERVGNRRSGKWIVKE